MNICKRIPLASTLNPVQVDADLCLTLNSSSKMTTYWYRGRVIDIKFIATPFVFVGFVFVAVFRFHKEWGSVHS